MLDTTGRSMLQLVLQIKQRANMSSNKYHSRHEQLDVEKCVRQSGGNKFDLILMASQRGREIKSQNQHSIHMEHHHGVITALLEIQGGKVDWEYFKKIK